MLTKRNFNEHKLFDEFLEILKTSPPGEHKLNVSVPTELLKNISDSSLELEFQFSKTEREREGGKTMILRVILPMDNGDSFFDLTLDTSQNMASLNLLQAAEGSDSINGKVLAHLKKKGEWLLHLAVVVSRRLGMDSLQLLDASSVRCAENDMDLKFINLMQYGKSWYQRIYAFRPIREDQNNTSKWEKIRKSSLDKLQTDLFKITTDAFWEKYDTTMEEFLTSSTENDRLSQRANVAEISTTILENIKTYKANNNEEKNLCDFFTWLAKHNCGSWIILYNFIFHDLIPSTNTLVRGRPHISTYHMILYNRKKFMPHQMNRAMNSLRLDDVSKQEFKEYKYVVDDNMLLYESSYVLGQLYQLEELKLILNIRKTYNNIDSAYLLELNK